MFPCKDTTVIGLPPSPESLQSSIGPSHHRSNSGPTGPGHHRDTSFIGPVATEAPRFHGTVATGTTEPEAQHLCCQFRSRNFSHGFQMDTYSHLLISPSKYYSSCLIMLGVEFITI